MDWIKAVQQFVPWLAAQRPLPKTIISALIGIASALILIFIWTPWPPPSEPASFAPQEIILRLEASSLSKVLLSILVGGLAAFVLTLIWMPLPEAAVETILAECHRRAIFMRMHAQMNVDAMFESVDRCREIVQINIPKIHREKLQIIAMELLAILDRIAIFKENRAAETFQFINTLKLAALHSFRELATLTNGNFVLPLEGMLAEGFFFTQNEADAPLTFEDLRYQLAINPVTGDVEKAGT